MGKVVVVTGHTLFVDGGWTAVQEVFARDLPFMWAAAGTPAQCVEHLRALQRDGARTFTLRITGGQQEEQYLRLVNEVLPKVDAA